MINMSNEQKKEFFQNWHDQWIKPELNRRFGETGIPENFVIRECLVTFPKGQVPIVQFDGEFGWHIQNPKLVGGKTPGDFGIGQPIHIYDILSIDSVLPPMIDGERVSFMYLYWDGFAYHLYVDFVPNQPEYDPNNEIFKFDGSVIALHLQNMLVERVVQWAKLHQPKLQQIGMWTATPLILYPLSRIVERIDKGKLEEARQILVDYCDAEFISTKLVQTWHPIKAYKERQRIFDDALFLHRNQRYHGSINTLVGQIEGVIVDWLHEVIPPSDVKWKTQSRIDQFRDALHAIPQLEYVK